MRSLRIGILLAVALVSQLSAWAVIVGSVRDRALPFGWARAWVTAAFFDRVMPALPFGERRIRTAMLHIACPSVEARVACGHRDFRLIGLGGVGLFFPGFASSAEAPLGFSWAERHGYRFMLGTSDYADSGAQMAYQQAAYDYAKEFNGTMRRECRAAQGSDAASNNSLQGTRHAHLWLAALGVIVLARP